MFPGVSYGAIWRLTLSVGKQDEVMWAIGMRRGRNKNTPDAAHRACYVDVVTADPTGLGLSVNRPRDGAWSLGFWLESYPYHRLPSSH